MLARKFYRASGQIGEDLVIFGGHASIIAVRALKKNLVKAIGIVVVAPTWAGPLPIVFGRDSDIETSNEKSIESQYKSHVYADAKNVTPQIIESRYKLIKRKGSRYVLAAFLTGLLDPMKPREEFVELFAELPGKLHVLVMSSAGIKACREMNKPEDEEKYEACLDNHGCWGGPKLGRLRGLQNQHVQQEIEITGNIPKTVSRGKSKWLKRLRSFSCITKREGTVDSLRPIGSDSIVRERVQRVKVRHSKKRMKELSARYSGT
ncbi:hypothetical protein POM88_043668 [Heracleum sosnowskyi]|uniref:Uncharacterized protein n=1 Tax=Heracleum sosnowskyi TaxID=360622 RepID=A0AAD8M4G9_9APIA|nr:hypothetical protein POM88_043668 [Heracleum sosnowskyi]